MTRADACLLALSARLEVLWRLCNLRHLLDLAVVTLERLVSKEIKSNFLSYKLHQPHINECFGKAIEKLEDSRMACFKSFQEGSMTILNDPTDKVENGTTLTVHPAFLGAWALQYEPIGDVLHLPQWAIETNCEVIGSKSDSHALLLQSAHHDEETDRPTPFSLLGHRIQTEEVVWGNTFKAIVDPSYCEGYWEWLEDILSRHEQMLKKAKIYEAIYASLFSYDRLGSVMRHFCELWSPSTNTLHTAVGEMSISLWDLKALGGLPISGLIYDEAVPRVDELIGVDKDNTYYLPVNCRYLFLAYHRLLADSKKGEVKIDAWVKFWFKGKISYSKSSKKTTRNKTQRPANVNNPSGTIGEAQVRTPKQEEVFTILGVKETQKDVAHLAAFLACWLCKFVLLVGSCELIRPGVFKVAAMMARGTRFCLAVPVLASIYRGLNDIAKSSTPGKCDAVFPVHYVYAWLGEYFGTHFSSGSQPSPQKPKMIRYGGERVAKQLDEAEALDLFRKCDGLVMDRFAQREGKSKELVDDGQLSDWEMEYLISIRSGYLTLRSGSTKFIEPYSPHRFSRQFGFTQDVPRILHVNLRICSLKNIVKHFESLTREKSQSKLRLPNRANCRAIPITKAYLEWWSHIYGDYFRSSTEHSMRGKRPASPKQQVVKAKKLATVEPRTELRTARVNGGNHDLVRSVVPLNKTTDERSSCEDRNWRHLKKKSGCGIAERGDVSFNDMDKLFEGVPSSSQPIQAIQVEEGDIIHNSKDENFILLDEQSMSGESVRGPSSFDLALRQRQNHAFGAIHLPSSSNTPKLGPAAPSTITAFDTGSTIVEARRAACSIMDNNIKSVLRKTPLEKLAYLGPKLQKIYDEFSKFQVDCSPLRIQIEKHVQNAGNYILMRSGFARGLTLEVQVQRLADVDQRLTNALALDGQKMQRAQVLNFELNGIGPKRVKLMKELELLDLQANKLKESIDVIDAERAQDQHVIANLQAERATLEAAEVIEKDDMEVANNLEQLLKSEQDEI
ncbi:hypothetical protein RHSIM_Rhsim05G0112600 [Rhododendron simsii]|uniref:Aminotransferase-like plant mobile domain-containing protein n=1 Tax=Rhododendron simsii TaxID=118357 RepID=A0A834GWT6_RHOSS|nr:hypothetical protein RHSIM_Rhsim05G0112600 [Rhododendron simsii]